MRNIVIDDVEYLINGYIIKENILIIDGLDSNIFPRDKKVYVLKDDLLVNISTYKYKFNVLTDYPDAILLTNDPNNIETEENPASKYYTPLTEEQKFEILKQKRSDLVDLSKNRLSDYLKENQLELTIAGHGIGFYTVTKEKQDQMFQMLSSYRTQKEFFPDAKILWNKSGEELEEWGEEDFLRLIREVNDYVQPRVKKQQKYEKDILAATTLEELDELEDMISYKEV